MLVLLTGATGFIGRHLLRALLARGHQVRCAVRAPQKLAGISGVEAVQADFARDHDAQTWLPRLAGVQAVVNTVGILREQEGQRFDALHARAPMALFAAACQAKVPLVVQISALGADEAATSDYHLSKREADRVLAQLPLHGVILQPSLVFGADGASARLFALLASLPLLPLPAGGRQPVQPLHIDDLCAAVLAVLERPPPPATRLPLVGPRALSLREYLQLLRRSLGGGRLLVLPVPLPLARLGAQAAARLPGALLDTQTLQMLERGNTADVMPMQHLLGRLPRAPENFIDADAAPALAQRARLDWLLPLLRLSVALVWIVTGIVSLGLYPVADSYALLARTGIEGMLAPVMLYGAALLDLAIGIGILMLRRRGWLWLLQLALIGFYTIVITLRLPEFWLHPYGPILKNLPLMAAIWLLYEFDKPKRWTT